MNTVYFYFGPVKTIIKIQDKIPFCCKLLVSTLNKTRIEDKSIKIYKIISYNLEIGDGFCLLPHTLSLNQLQFFYN